MHFDLNDNSKLGNKFTRYLVESCGLLDMPGSTLGWRNPCKRIWSRFVTPFQRKEIDPTTGLSRSLQDIIAWLDSPGAEHELLLWQPEKAEHVIQYHFWEAYRLGTLLLHRSLRAVHGAYSTTTANDTANEFLIMGVFASVHAVRNVRNDPFRMPLRRCLLFPLWIAVLNTEQGTEARNIASQEFEV